MGRWEDGWGCSSPSPLLPAPLLSHDVTAQSSLALQLRSPCRVPATFCLFLHQFYSGLALVALNGVVDKLPWYKWVMGIHVRWFVLYSAWCALGKEEFWCESLF